jgi:hypothetical protein
MDAMSAVMAMVSVESRISPGLHMCTELRSGQEGSAMSKTRRFEKKSSKHQGCDGDAI